MGSLLVDAFLFPFLPDGQIRLCFLCLSDSRHLCRSLFPGFPFPLPFLPHVSQLAAALLCPPFLPLSYLLLCNLFAARLSLWFTGPLLSRIIINGLLCCIPASSPPLCSLGQAPCKQDACSLHKGTCSHALINPLHLSLAKYNEKSQVIHLRPN